MTTIIRYTLEEFNTIMFDGIQLELPKDTIDLITSIANQVGATDYIRTPQFPKRVQPPGVGVGIGACLPGNRRRQKNQEINDEDWDTIRKFQTTEIKKNEGLQACIDEIRKSLNKVTEKTYEKIFTQICSEIDKIIETNVEDISNDGVVSLYLNFIDFIKVILLVVKLPPYTVMLPSDNILGTVSVYV